ncbi:MAG TPA: RsmE family RNA methyltransferase [Gemmatimonadaceae bacterium]|nr:RsmE family RNA methyltransferase [Gemmatimonadaceae bacterium]
MITLFWPSVRVGEVELDESRTQHARVRRLASGDPVRLVDGAGSVGIGVVASIGKRAMSVRVEHVTDVARPPDLTLFVPVADRDRMLLAAEKSVELQATEWQAVYFARSRSVSPRGDGPRFHEKVLARMQSALEQSDGAWRPVVRDDIEFDAALEHLDASHVVLDRSGEPLDAPAWASVRGAVIGPEGGFEDAEVDRMRARGCRVATVGTSTLRFETAIIACATLIRASQLSTRNR